MKKVSKVISSLAVILVLLMGMSSAVYAQDASVTYEGNSRNFIFAPGSEESPTDLFADFKGVMPGDQLNQKINVKNTASDKVTVEIFLKADGAVEDAEFLNQMNLTVTDKSGNKLFDAPADQTAGLTDWVSLGKFKSGADVNLDVALNVPVTMGNDFQDRIGKLNWTFKVVETPVPAPGVKTGDSTNIAVPLIVLAAAIVLIVVLIKKKKN